MSSLHAVLENRSEVKHIRGNYLAELRHFTQESLVVLKSSISRYGDVVMVYRFKANRLPIPLIQFQASSTWLEKRTIVFKKIE